MPNYEKVSNPELDAGSGAAGSSGGPVASGKKGSKLGPFRVSTVTPQTSTPLGRGDKSKANGQQVGTIKSFEFNEPRNTQDLISSFEISEINLKMENPKYMENLVQEPSQSLTNIVHDYSYAKDCTIFGESEFETNGSFSFNEPICTNRNTKSFESIESNDEPISVNPIFTEPDVPLNNSKHKTMFYDNSNFKVKEKRKEEGEQLSPPGEKRKEREGDVKEGAKRKRESRVPREPKMTFAEATKGLEVVEVRSSTGIDNLQHEDYELIESQLLFRFAAILPKPCFQYGVEKLGCSQGGVWIACNGPLTVEFVLQNVPDIQSPIGRFYTYKVYAPGSKPFVYYKARFPKRFWCEPKDLVQLIKRLNWSLDFKVDAEEDSDMEDSVDSADKIRFRKTSQKDVHMRVSSGMRDPTKDIKYGFFIVTLECDERLRPHVIQMNGVINLGATKVEMYGGGLDKDIQEEKEKEDKDRAEAERLLQEEYNKDTEEGKERPWEDQVEDLDQNALDN